MFDDSTNVWVNGVGGKVRVTGECNKQIYVHGMYMMLHGALYVP